MNKGDKTNPPCIVGPPKKSPDLPPRAIRPHHSISGPKWGSIKGHARPHGISWKVYSHPGVVRTQPLKEPPYIPYIPHMFYLPQDACIPRLQLKPRGFRGSSSSATLAAPEWPARAARWWGCRRPACGHIRSWVLQLPPMVSESPLVLGLGTRLRHPHVDVVFGSLSKGRHDEPWSNLLIGLLRKGVSFFINTYIYIYVRTYKPNCACICVYIYMCAHICLYVYMYVYIYIYI